MSNSISKTPIEARGMRSLAPLSSKYRIMPQNENSQDIRKNILIKTDGSQSEVSPKDGQRFGLEELQGYVGGYIEIINLTANKALVINEEGKLFDLPLNQKATALAQFCGAIFPSDYIVGDAVVIENHILD